MSPMLQAMAADIGEAEIKAVAEVLRSGWLTTGFLSDHIETLAAAHLGVAEACAVSSCSAALHLALLALGVGPGDEVILSPLTFASVAHAVHHCGAVPVLADVVLGNLTIDPKSAAQALTDRTAAIIGIVYGGDPAGLERLAELGPPLLIDAAHGFGARLGSRPLEDFGALVCYSFYATKMLTSAEGGLVTGRADLLEQIRLTRNNGLSAAAHLRETVGSYDVVSTGFKYTLPDVLAALVQVQLQRFPSFVSQREELAKRYLIRLSGIVGLTIPQCRPGRCWWAMTVILPSSVDRDGFRAALTKRGVQTTVLFTPLHHFSHFQNIARPIPLSTTEAVWHRLVTLPMHTKMTVADVDTVCDAVESTLSKQS